MSIIWTELGKICWAPPQVSLQHCYPSPCHGNDYLIVQYSYLHFATVVLFPTPTFLPRYPLPAPAQASTSKLETIDMSHPGNALRAGMWHLRWKTLGQLSQHNTGSPPSRQTAHQSSLGSSFCESRLPATMHAAQHSVTSLYHICLLLWQSNSL